VTTHFCAHAPCSTRDRLHLTSSTCLLSVPSSSTAKVVGTANSLLYVFRRHTTTAPLAPSLPSSTGACNSPRHGTSHGARLNAVVVKKSPVSRTASLFCFPPFDLISDNSHRSSSLPLSRSKSKSSSRVQHNSLDPQLYRWITGSPPHLCHAVARTLFSVSHRTESTLPLVDVLAHS
jgi:hypothetical protein